MQSSFQVVVLAYICVCGVSGEESFASALYKEVAKNQNGNILISPLSVKIALGLVQAGADSETADELSPMASESDVLGTNLVYTQNGVTLKNNFKQIIKTAYSAHVNQVDTSGDSAIVKTVVKMVNKFKAKRMTTAIDRNLLVMANSLYLSEKWLESFDANLTNKENFYRSADDVIAIDTMHHQSAPTVGYEEDAQLNAKFIEIPFASDAASFVLVLPNEQDGIGDLEDNIDAVLSRQISSTAAVDVALPKIRSASTIDLKDILRKLGVKKAFSSEANFDVVTGSEVYIGDMLQATDVVIDERGVRVAETDVVMEKMTSVKADAKVNVDHPFLYFIKVGGEVVFVAKVIDPTH